MKHFYFAVSLLLVLASCSMPKPQQGANPVATSAAQTVEAALATATFAAAAQKPLATQVLSTAVPTLTAGCEDAAINTIWNRDNVLYDANVVNQPLAPNSSFVMSWTFQNTGTCTWDATYLMYFESGTTMTQSPGFPLMPASQTVAPGQSVTVDIRMTAPANAGDYQSSWRLQNNKGKALMNFGVLLKVGGASSNVLLRPENLRYE